MKKIGLYLSLAFLTYLVGQFMWILTFIYDEPIFGSEYLETMTWIIIFFYTWNIWINRWYNALQIRKINEKLE